MQIFGWTSKRLRYQESVFFTSNFTPANSFPVVLEAPLRRPDQITFLQVLEDQTLPVHCSISSLTLSGVSQGEFQLIP